MASAPYAGGSSLPRRPAWLTAVAIVAGIALGGIGLLLVGSWLFLPVSSEAVPEGGHAGDYGSGWSTLIQSFVFVSVIPIAAAVLATVAWLQRRHPRRASGFMPELPAAGVPSIESRLVEIDHLLVMGRITQDEHAAMRSRILDLQ